MNEPGPNASDAELAEYYDTHHDGEPWDVPRPVSSDRLDVTISVRFTAAEIATIRARAEAAGVKPTVYIRRLALAGEQSTLDRGQLWRMVDVLTRDLDQLRQAAG